PVALISLAGRDRQHIKSKKGLDEIGRSQESPICEDAFLQPGLFIVADTRRDSRFASTPILADAPHLRFYAGVQLKSQKGYHLGTLCVLDREPRELDENQRFVLQTLANQVVKNLEMNLVHQDQARVIQDLRVSQHEMSRQVATDPLTNLLNRRGFEQRLNQELAFIKRGAPSSALLLIDIDHFKQVNDRRGHKAGDQVLVQFSELCRKVFREADVICRWGGEEFLVMLPGSTMAEAQHAAKRLNECLATVSMVDSASPPLFITVSIGINALTASSTTDTFLRSIDDLLYEAKAQGRNRIVCEPQEHALSDNLLA
ncbi:diguanylate cyclase, partial [Roseovarius sp.]|uniref:sensor domain-containing diguanylate cyclase n=1 Tax=Roseovarius sp. TaxID=1486281 RepID=UPI003562A69E